MVVQELYRKYAALGYGALCAVCLLLLAGLALSLGYHPLMPLPLLLVLALGVPYFNRAYTYRYNGSRLEVHEGRGRECELMTIIDAGDILSYGVYLPGQLSARQADRIVRAHLFLDVHSKRCLLYRLPGGGTGLLIFSPDKVMMDALIREQWIFQTTV